MKAQLIEEVDMKGQLWHIVRAGDPLETIDCISINSDGDRLRAREVFEKIKRQSQLPRRTVLETWDSEKEAMPEQEHPIAHV